MAIAMSMRMNLAVEVWIYFSYREEMATISMQHKLVVANMAESTNLCRDDRRLSAGSKFVGMMRLSGLVGPC